MGLLDRFRAKGAYSSISKRQREQENAERKIREEDRKKELRRVKEDAEFEAKKQRVKRNAKEKYSPKRGDANPFSGNPFAGFGVGLSATDSGKRGKSTSSKPKKGKKDYVVVGGKAYEKGGAKKKREPREQRRSEIPWADVTKAP